MKSYFSQFLGDFAHMNDLINRYHVPSPIHLLGSYKVHVAPVECRKQPIEVLVKDEYAIEWPQLCCDDAVGAAISVCV